MPNYRQVSRCLQWLAGCLGLAMVFVRSGAQRRGVISVFRGFSSSIGKDFILAGGLGIGLSF